MSRVHSTLIAEKQIIRLTVKPLAEKRVDMLNDQRHYSVVSLRRRDDNVDSGEEVRVTFDLDALNALHLEDTVRQEADHAGCPGDGVDALVVELRLGVVEPRPLLQLHL